MSEWLTSGWNPMKGISKATAEEILAEQTVRESYET